MMGIVNDDQLPPLPQPDAKGRFPAIEYARASLARNFIRDRRSVGLTQQRLADLCELRQETIARLETGKHTASPATVEKIEQAIEAERKKLARKKGK